MNKINPFFSEMPQQIHKMYMYEKVAIITQIWYRVRCDFTSTSNAWYLINVLNMNKITTFLEISQPKTQNLSENNHYNSNWAEPNSILHASAAHDT